MSISSPPSPRNRAPLLTGKETWLDPEGKCTTTRAEIAAQGTPEPVQMSIMFLRALSYEDYLKSTHWQAIRRDVWIAQDGKCALCPTGVIRDTHHLKDGYTRLGFERDTDVIGVCGQCHNVEHNAAVIQLREEMRNQRQ